MPESVYVVMPAHNEGRVIASVIYRVRESLPDAHVVIVLQPREGDLGAPRPATTPADGRFHRH